MSDKKNACPVCDWEIEGKGITVRVDGREVTVCCDECAEKVRQPGAGG